MTVIAALDEVITRLADLADNPNISYDQLVIAFSWLQTGFEVYLFRRQIKEYYRPAPPPELKSHTDPETFRKSQKYGLEKTRYNLVKTVFDQFLNWGMIKFGLYAKTWDMAGRGMVRLGLSADRVIIQSLFWMLIITVISAIPSIPWNYYYNFHLEERHGFNKSTVALWVTDQVKTLGLLAVIGLPIMAGFLRVIGWAGKSFVPWLMLFMVSVQLVLQIVYPTFIQPLFNKLTALPAGDLRERVEKLAGKLGFPLTHLYVIDGSKRSGHSNAYFYGLPWSKHIVIYDTLIEKSSPAEVEAVLAHELGHWHFTHPTKLLLLAQTHLLTTLTLFSVFIHNRSLYSAFGFDAALASPSPLTGRAQPIIIGFMLFQLVLEPADTLVKFLLNAQTRKYEYQADEFAVQLGKKDELAAALIKLHADNLSSPHNDKLYSMYHHSHPTLPERLRAMDDLSPGTKLRKRGDQKKEL